MDEVKKSGGGLERAARRWLLTRKDATPDERLDADRELAEAVAALDEVNPAAPPSEEVRNAVWWREKLARAEQTLAAIAKEIGAPRASDYSDLPAAVRKRLGGDLAAQARAAGAEEQLVTREGFTQLTERMLESLGLQRGGYLWFLRSTPGGRWEAWQEHELSELLGLSGDAGPSAPEPNLAPLTQEAVRLVVDEVLPPDDRTPEEKAASRERVRAFLARPDVAELRAELRAPMDAFIAWWKSARGQRVNAEGATRDVARGAFLAGWNARSAPRQDAIEEARHALLEAQGSMKQAGAEGWAAAADIRRALAALERARGAVPHAEGFTPGTIPSGVLNELHVTPVKPVTVLRTYRGHESTAAPDELPLCRFCGVNLATSPGPCSARPEGLAAASPAVDPARVAALAERFKRADPKWHGLLDEVQRRYQGPGDALETQPGEVTAEAVILDAGPGEVAAGEKLTPERARELLAGGVPCTECGEPFAGRRIGYAEVIGADGFSWCRDHRSRAKRPLLADLHPDVERAPTRLDARRLRELAEAAARAAPGEWRTGDDGVAGQWHGIYAVCCDAADECAKPGDRRVVLQPNSNYPVDPISRYVAAVQPSVVLALLDALAGSAAVNLKHERGLDAFARRVRELVLEYAGIRADAARKNDAERSPSGTSEEHTAVNVVEDLINLFAALSPTTATWTIVKFKNYAMSTKRPGRSREMFEQAAQKVEAAARECEIELGSLEPGWP